MMSSAGPGRRNILQQPPSVDFIENRLPAIHSAFEDLPIQYDPVAGRFIPSQEAVDMPLHRQQHRLAAADATADAAVRGPLPASMAPNGRGDVQVASAPRQLPARPLPPGTEAMKFWGKILDEAMILHRENNQTEPKVLLKKPVFSIRGQGSWGEIYQRLQDARVEFDGTKSKFWGRVKKGYRQAADKTNNAYVDTALQLIPDHDMVSPVKAALEVIVEAAKAAATVRGQVTAASDYDKLEKTFAKIETFLSVFPGDKNIEEASVELLACVMNAIEMTIAYYLSSTAERMWKALRDGEDYQGNLITSIDEIDAAVQKLILEAQISGIAGTREAMERVLNGVEQLVLLEVHNRGQSGVILANIQDLFQQGEELMIQLKESEAVIVAEVQRTGNELKKEIADLVTVANQIKSMLDDGAAGRSIAVTLTLPKDAVDEFKFLRARVDELEQNQLLLNQRPDSGYALTPSHPLEGLPWYSTPPSPQPQPLQATYGHQPPHYPQQPPFYAQDVWLQLPQGLHYPQPPKSPEPIIPASALLHFFADIINLDVADINTILDFSHAIPLRSRSRAKQVISTPQFTAWATASTSRELLIRGSPGADATSAKQAMSLVAASLVVGLRGTSRIQAVPPNSVASGSADSRFVSLIFFCGRHIESDDEFVGGAAMIRSFIAQLLQGDDEFTANTTFWQREVDLDALHQQQSGDVVALCGLFAMLVSRLPRHKTVVCVVDGIECYERREYEGDMRVVLGWLVGLARDESIGPAVKVLVTSPVGTVSVHEAFEDGGGYGGREEENVLFLEGLPLMGEEYGLLDVEGGLL